ncbi:MAG: SUMF1/EgtB/PvdO family nonheme iron enzyme, partial [Planctomycetes bacterium]|nr:SUMF1/EgtB/PvdO family nonheme iron enzyme [Planctomycetota bacterium]
AFCDALSARLVGWTATLPTNAQWQYAAMGGLKYAKYPTGDDYAALADFAWLKENCGGGSQAVAKKKANPFGLFDMTGNVEEWCWDAAGDLPKTELVDWTGPGMGDNRTAHGANFSHGAAEAAVGRRSDLLSSVLLWEVGFRVVLMKGSDPRPHVRKLVVPLDPAKKVSMEFALVPAGKYSVGDPDGGPTATPHDVTLTRDFMMATSETTQAQWEAVMGDHHAFTNPGPDLPAENVTWDEAAEFAKRLSKFKVRASLPTEAEWEVACRAGTPWRWASGDAAERASEIAWHKGNSTASQPVRTRRPNALGIYDMSGNVFEWCQDWYAPYPDGALKDPEGPKDGKEKVMRGGCYTDDVAGAKSSARNKFVPSGRQMNMGFRVVVR